MAADNVTVIDIIAQVTDDTQKGAASATRTVSKFEQSMKKAQDNVNKLNKMSKIEIALAVKDKVTKTLQSVWDKGKQLAGKVWNVTIKAVDMVTAPFRGILKAITNPLVAAAGIAGISFGVKDVIDTFKDFEQAMSDVQATALATDDDMVKLTAAAKKWGAESVYSATEAAQALNYMALAGYDTEKSIAMLPKVLDLASAGAMDLAYASDVITDASSALGLSIDQTGELIDQMALASSKSNTSVSQLGEAILTVGGTAKNLKGGMTEMNTVLGILADNGIKGAEGGTALRNMILSLSAPTASTAKTMKKLGLNVFDAEGSMRGMDEIFGDLDKTLSKMTQQQQTEVLSDIFNKVDLKSVNALLANSGDRFKYLSGAIKDSKGAAEKMAKIKMDNLAGAFEELGGAVDTFKINMGEKLAPYLRQFAEWVTGKMPEIEAAAGKALDFIDGKLKKVQAAISSLVASPEWQNAEGLWGKVKVGWNKLIAEPFDAWWNGSGKAWMSEKMNDVGKGIGNAIKGGLLALLGFEGGDALTDGVNIGKSFMDGFLEGFDGKVIAEALKGAVKGIFKDASTILPGGDETSATAPLSAALVGGAAVKTGIGAYKVGKGINNGVKGVKSVAGMFTKTPEMMLEAAVKAEQAGKTAKSAQLFSKALKAEQALGGAGKVGATAAKTGGMTAGKAIPLIGGVISLAEMGVDAYHGVGNAEEWTGSNSTGNKIASGVGGFFGGTGGGVTDKTTSTKDKALAIGGGALKGMGVGAAIGSVVPVIGTAVGGAVGAVVGGVGAAIGGKNIAKALSTAGKGIAHFFTKMIPDFFSTLWEGVTGFFTETVPNALSSIGQAISGFFTETIPAKFAELMDGIKKFFGETIPYAIGYIVGSIQVFLTETVPNAIAKVGEGLRTFFTETVPNFFKNLWGGIVTFFTETVPNGLAAIGAALSTFFTETVPEFFTGLWDGIVTFFTEKVPETLTAVGEALGTFFTETVPNFFKSLWDGVTGFFTETLPGVITDVKASISGFFTTAKEKITGFFTGIWDGITEFFGGAADSLKAGYTDATAHAQGGMFSSPHLGMVAEDGAEAIIPLSPGRRGRGLSLWEQAGEQLGVKPYAEGGIISDAAPAGNSGMVVSVPVEIGNINFEISAGNGGDSAPSAESILAVIRANVSTITDELAYRIAISLQKVFANMPAVAEGV